MYFCPQKLVTAVISKNKLIAVTKAIVFGFTISGKVNSNLHGEAVFGLGIVSTFCLSKFNTFAPNVPFSTP